MAHLESGFDQCLLEGERATEDEGNKIVAPQIHQVVGFSHLDAVAKNAVTRNIGADIEVGTKPGQARVARLAHAQYRAGLGIGLAKAQELFSVIARQDGDIALCVAGRLARGLAAEAAGTDQPAQVGRLLDDAVCGRGRRGGGGHGGVGEVPACIVVLWRRAVAWSCPGFCGAHPARARWRWRKISAATACIPLKRWQNSSALVPTPVPWHLPKRSLCRGGGRGHCGLDRAGGRRSCHPRAISHQT